MPNPEQEDIESFGVQVEANRALSDIGFSKVPLESSLSIVSSPSVGRTLEKQIASYTPENGELEFYLSGSLPLSLYAKVIDQWSIVKVKTVLTSFYNAGQLDSQDIETRTYWNFFKLFLVGWPCLLCFLLQGTLLFYLWFSLPDLNDPVKSGFCVTQPVFMLALITAFYSSMIRPCLQICWEFYCIALCEKVYLPKEKVIADNTVVLWKKLSMLVVLAQETTIFVAILIVGTKYIATSIGASNLIQSSVAIVFISTLNDEFAKVIYSKEHKHMIYICPWLTNSTEIEQRSINEAREAKNRPVLTPADVSYEWVTLVFNPVVFTCVCVGVVYGLRHSYCTGFIPVSGAE